MKDKCIVKSIQDLCKCPDKLVQEVKVERYGPLALIESILLPKKTNDVIPSGCIFPRAIRLKVEGAKVDSINGLGKVMPMLLEADIQRNHISSIDAKTLPRRLSTLRLDGNPVEKIENTEYLSMLEELSLANATGTLNIDWIKNLDKIKALNLSNKKVIPPVYRTQDGKMKYSGKKLGPKEIWELKEYLRQYPLEIQMAEEEVKRNE